MLMFFLPYSCICIERALFPNYMHCKGQGTYSTYASWASSRRTANRPQHTPTTTHALLTKEEFASTTTRTRKEYLWTTNKKGSCIYIPSIGDFFKNYLDPVSSFSVVLETRLCLFRTPNVYLLPNSQK